MRIRTTFLLSAGVFTAIYVAVVGRLLLTQIGYFSISERDKFLGLSQNLKPP